MAHFFCKGPASTKICQYNENTDTPSAPKCPQTPWRMVACSHLRLLGLHHEPTPPSTFITSDHDDTFPQQWQSSPSLSRDPMSWHGLGSLRLSHSLLQFLQLLHTNAFFFYLQPCPVFESWHDEKTTCYLWSPIKHDSSLTRTFYPPSARISFSLETVGLTKTSNWMYPNPPPFYPSSPTLVVTLKAKPQEACAHPPVAERSWEKSSDHVLNYISCAHSPSLQPYSHGSLAGLCHSS